MYYITYDHFILHNTQHGYTQRRTIELCSLKDLVGYIKILRFNKKEQEKWLKEFKKIRPTLKWANYSERH